MFSVIPIGERRPIIQPIKVSGEKTLFVDAQMQWPPNTLTTMDWPLDIEIEVRYSYGSISNTDTFRLPNVGAYKSYSGDILEAFATYIDRGVVKPHKPQEYNIVTDVKKGTLPRTRTTEVRYYYITIDSILTGTVSLNNWIPKFASEYRITTQAHGYFTLHNYFIGGTPAASVYFGESNQFNDCQIWRSIPAIALMYDIEVFGTTLGGCEFTIEFR